VTRFQFAIGPHAAIILLIILSGTFSLIFPVRQINPVEKEEFKASTSYFYLPMKTVILGPSSNSIV
jgi:hypothetical protein